MCCNLCRICGCNVNLGTILMMLIVLAGATIGAIYYEQTTGNDIPFLPPMPNMTTVRQRGKGLIDRIGDAWPDFGFDYDNIGTFDGAPDGTGYGNVSMTGWKLKGSNSDENGLVLLVENALSDEWHEYFDEAITDWSTGVPYDVLTLPTENNGVDTACTPKEGRMKVCNDNYGETGWKGINEMLTQNGYIVASVAKMNEAYLGADVKFKNTDITHERQYTMCHEIGHGFGLPHQDEDFNNQDLYSCMDYSSRPHNNLTPNEEDFRALNALYGKDSDKFRRRRLSLRNTSPTAIIPYNQNRPPPEYVWFNGRVVEKHTFYLPAYN